jgi:Protein of unknown function (DUF1569)
MLKTLASSADKADIVRRLGALRPDSARRWGRMSAHQMVCHLSDGYRMLTDRRVTALTPSPLPRGIIKLLALYVPINWRANLPTTPELDQAGSGTRPSDFALDVAELIQLLDEITTDVQRHGDGPLHPLFGRMSPSAWMRWAYLHADHHLRQFGV